MSNDKVKQLKKKVQNKCENYKSQQKTYDEIKQKIEASLTIKEQEQLAIELIKSKYSKSSGQELLFSQKHGKPLRIAVNQQRKAIPQISAKDVCKVQTNLSLTSNETFSIARDFRVGVQSRKLFESGLKDKVSIFNHRLDQYFEIHKSEFSHMKANRKSVTKQSQRCRKFVSVGARKARIQRCSLENRNRWGRAAFSKLHCHC